MPSARSSHPSGPEALIRSAIAAPDPRVPLLASIAASGTASAPRAGSANDPPYGWPAPLQSDGDLDHIRTLPRAEIAAAWGPARAFFLRGMGTMDKGHG